MDYGERFNYGKIKDDFGYPNDKGYYSSTYTSFDSKFNQIPSLEDLEKEYPDKLKTFRWGKGNQFFATYTIGNFGELELLDTNWYQNEKDEQIKSLQQSLKESDKEQKRLQHYNDYLRKQIEALKENFKEKDTENKRKAKAFDKLYKILFGKVKCNQDYKDYYAFASHIKIGSFLESESLEMEELSDKETIDLINALLEGINAEYRVESLGRNRTNEPNNGGTYVNVKWSDK